MNSLAATSWNGPFWRSALSSDLTLWCAGIILVLIAVVVVMFRMIVRLQGPERSRKTWRDESGVVTIEFALLLPILLWISLVLSQTTLTMAGNLFVHYAAFAATRTAVVQIPKDYSDSGPNFYSEGGTKREAIWRTAVFSLVPVSGRGGSSSIPAGPLVSALNEFFSGYGHAIPPWVAALMSQRLGYAAEHTQVTVMTPRVINGSQVTYDTLNSGRVDPKSPISVKVVHKLNLSIPYANRIYADGVHANGRNRYTIVTAVATLTNEGITDEFPPLPDLPRLP